MSVSKKDKIKNKLAAKKEKLVAKLKGTNEVKKAITATAILCVALFLSGCQSTPSRAQTQTIKDCTFYVMVPSGGQTNAAASAVGTVGDLFAQNMVIENSGTETLTPTQTISPTTTLSYGVGGGDSLASLLTSLKNMLGMGSSASAATATPTPAAASDCSDGSCTVP